MKRNDSPVMVSTIYKCNPKQLWEALTHLEEMKKWYFDNIPDFKVEIGFKTKFSIINEPRTFTHNWEVTHFEDSRSIQYSWTFDEYPGKSYSRFEIDPLNNEQTKLSLTCKVIEDFPQDIDEFKRESCEGGWNYFLNDRLKSYFTK